MKKFKYKMFLTGGFIMVLASLAIRAADQVAVKEIKTVEQAREIAPLYVSYYKRQPIDEASFLERWQLANAKGNYHMIAAYSLDTPQGFIDFSIIPSIFWEPSLARIDSVFVHNPDLENDISEALFQKAFEVMGQSQVSKVIAVSCANYQQEVRLLTKHLKIDDDPSKTQFMLMMDRK